MFQRRHTLQRPRQKLWPSQITEQPWPPQHITIPLVAVGPQEDHRAQAEDRKAHLSHHLDRRQPSKQQRRLLSVPNLVTWATLG